VEHDPGRRPYESEFCGNGLLHWNVVPHAHGRHHLHHRLQLEDDQAHGRHHGSHVRGVCGRLTYAHREGFPLSL